MATDYRLVESVVVLEGTIERESDRWLHSEDVPDWGSADVSVVLAARGDEGSGQMELDLTSLRGDAETSVELTADQRLTALAYKSVGIGTRVLDAGATLVATVAGVALRAAGGAGAPMLARFVEPADARATRLTCEGTARPHWDQCHPDEAAHHAAYAALLDQAQAGLLEARQNVVAGETPATVLHAASRAARLEAIVDRSRQEMARVDALFDAWRAGQRSTRTESLGYALAVDTLPTHSPDTDPVPAALEGPAFEAWDRLGVMVEIGPADGYAVHRRRSTATNLTEDALLVQWRVPRPVRLWVWQRGEDEAPTLVRTFEAAVVDRYSDVRALRLEDAVFGEKGGSIAFDGLGAPTKIVRNDKSASGAFADALAATPGSIAAALEQATKITTSVAALADAGEERRLATLKREVARRTSDLELKGLRATEEDFALAKRLEQQVAMATAAKELTPGGVSELTRLQDELAMATARRDLEAVSRQRALDLELAAAQAEIAILTTELDLERARRGGA